jgi:hypothetical protein
MELHNHGITYMPRYALITYWHLTLFNDDILTADVITKVEIDGKIIKNNEMVTIWRQK